MGSERPDPDLLLRQVQQEERRNSRGRLKIFLGASAGVGKTYAILSAAHEQRERGVDVVIGYIETHGRKETEALVRDLPSVPMRVVSYRGVEQKEFNLDGVLSRKPALVLVDELPHTNVPGSRHSKRWQDVDELLQAGIDVFTAINVQHIESLRDVVAQITGVVVQETVPDTFIEQADEIEVIDIPPDELRQRLADGKIYVPTQIERALEGFFKKGNLIALRELALRRAADRVDAQMQSYREDLGINGVWAARDRLLVCIAPNKLGEKVVRTAARIGNAAHAHVTALYVESDRQYKRTAEEQDAAQCALKLSESLGMETATRSGHDIVGEILHFANQRNISLIIVGKPIKPRWKEILHGSVVDELVRRSGEISVHVVTGSPSATLPRKQAESGTPVSFNPISYLATFGVIALATGLCSLIHVHLELANLVMIYLLGVAFVATRYRVGESIFAAVLSVAAFDFFFVPPRFTFAVSDVQYLPTFAIMLGVALLISSLAFRLRHQADSSSARERRTAALYDLSKQMAASRSKKEIAQAAARKIREEFDVDSGVLLPSERGYLSPVVKSRSHFETDRSEAAVAEWCFKHGMPAGLGTDTLPGSKGLYLPLKSAEKAVGVLALQPLQADGKIDPHQLTLLETFANGMGVAIERTLLAKETQDAKVEIEAQRIRNALLSSVSHDLRTPLTSISGAADSLVKSLQGVSPEQQELLKGILTESQRLNNHVQNLLDMTRLESGPVSLTLDWESVEELVGSALNQCRVLLDGRPITTEIPSSLPLIKLDAKLMVTALVNLFENVARHTPAGTSMDLQASVSKGVMKIEVSDRGPGLPAGEELRIFEKFHRPTATGDTEGFGLGLSIVRAVAQAHHGTATAMNRPDGGARFVIEIPMTEAAPEVPIG